MLTINNVEKRYGNTYALSGVTLGIPAGLCFGLAGPNGAGKSTLLKIIASVISDYSGSVRLLETTIQQNIKKKIGYVPQEICLEPSVSAANNLYFFGRLYGLKSKKLRDRAQEVLEAVGLKERANDKILTFSGGMKRRLNIGCALMHYPELIIMDEPTVGVDPQSRAFIFQMIESMKQAGRTIIYSSHYMEEIEQICDEVAFLDHGEIIENGKIDGLLQKYAVPAVFIKGKNLKKEDLPSLDVVEYNDGGLLIKTKSPLKTMEEVIAILKQSNLELTRMELVQPGLDNIFMDLTGKALRD